MRKTRAAHLVDCHHGSQVPNWVMGKGWKGAGKGGASADPNWRDTGKGGRPAYSSQQPAKKYQGKGQAKGQTKGGDQEEVLKLLKSLDERMSASREEGRSGCTASSRHRLPNG